MDNSMNDVYGKYYIPNHKYNLMAVRVILRKRPRNFLDDALGARPLNLVFLIDKYGSLEELELICSKINPKDIEIESFY